jgi:hypothetical protein
MHLYTNLAYNVSICTLTMTKNKETAKYENNKLNRNIQIERIV